jgi:hypothetical protein
MTKCYLNLGSFYSAEAPAPLKWGDFEPSSGIGKLKNFAGAGPPGPLFLLGLGWAGSRLFLAQALGHIWAISGSLFFEILLVLAGPGIVWPGRWATSGSFFNQSAESHKGDFSNMPLDHIGTIF